MLRLPIYIRIGVEHKQCSRASQEARFDARTATAGSSAFYMEANGCYKLGNDTLHRMYAGVLGRRGDFPKQQVGSSWDRIVDFDHGLTHSLGMQTLAEHGGNLDNGTEDQGAGKERSMIDNRGGQGG
ncbi:prolidase PepP [Aspergillus luchuensis]|uniref:Prolidase PepP n=1 Tax=Aspergillus kawachii TaxID=1069201 RepID=A0A146F9H9_ASPKA|nr:prolidase PepP [Aspergillus luchuensis]